MEWRLTEGESDGNGVFCGTNSGRDNKWFFSRSRDLHLGFSFLLGLDFGSSLLPLFSQIVESEKVESFPSLEHFNPSSNFSLATVDGKDLRISSLDSNRFPLFFRRLLDSR